MWKQGREGYVQYILSLLLCETPPPGYNKPVYPSTSAELFLAEMMDRAFGDRPDAPQKIYWEFRLPKAPEDKENAWPDLAVLWLDRLLMMELKTERGSHRDGQVDWYLKLGAVNYPELKVDLIYLTTDPVDKGPSNLPENARYANLTWRSVAEMIEDVWDPGMGEEGANAFVFAQYLRGIGSVVDAPLPSRTSKEESGTPDESRAPVVEIAGRSAETQMPVQHSVSSYGDESLSAFGETVKAVAEDGKQRAVDLSLESVEMAKEAKSRMRAEMEMDETLHGYLENVELWIWRRESTGQPLTTAGAESGIELRVSRRKAASTS